MGYDQEHFEAVRQGASAVSQWRVDHPGEVLQLRRADFAHTNLSGYDLRDAELEFADFRGADLQSTKFRGANLQRADFHKADLSYSDMSNTDLRYTNLEDAVLTKAQLQGAKLGRTRLLDTDMSSAIGLAETIHEETSFINSETITKSQPLPNAFLQGCGYFAPVQATVLRVVIGSPSDVADERDAIRNAILDWNDQFMEREAVVLKPVMWERHSTPEMSSDSIDHGAQFVVNRQLIDQGHILVCVFWSRIGSQTPRAESGTIEEIQQFVDTGRPVMIYFCTKPIPQHADWKQWEALRQWKESVRKTALVDEFETLEELQKKVSRHIGVKVDNLVSVMKERESDNAPATVESTEANEFITELANSLIAIHLAGTQLEARHINPWLDLVRESFRFESNRLRELSINDYAEQLDLTDDLKNLARACEQFAKFRLYSGPEIWAEFVSLAHVASDQAMLLFKRKIEDSGAAKRAANQASKTLNTMLRRLEDFLERLEDLKEAHEFDEIKDGASRIGDDILRLSYLGVQHLDGVEIDELRNGATTLSLTETVRLIADGGKSIEGLLGRVRAAASEVKGAIPSQHG